MLIVSFGSARISKAVSQKLGFGVTVAVFLFVLGLLMQVVESPETKPANEARDDEEIAAVWAQQGTLGSPVQPLSTGQQREGDPLAGSINNQNYTFGSVDSATSADGNGSSQPARIGSLAYNNASAAASANTMTGFGGGAPGSEGAAASEAVSVRIPETVSPILLLGVTLVAILALDVIRRRSAPASRRR